jgi:cellulose biosynthesis protein BcsQ
MRIVTISGFKGGTGKTTIAALLGVAAVKDGLKTAALDLDRNTRNLSGFLNLRRNARLESPDHIMLMEADGAAEKRFAGRLEPLLRMAQMDGYDLVIIDTSSGHLADVYEAHLMADVVITPMNESPADAHGLFTAPNQPSAPKVNYRDMIETARFDRRRSGKPAQEWHVVMNRISPLPTRIGALMQERVAEIGATCGFTSDLRVRDRVAHRSISLDGRTVFDAPVDGRLTMSELSGRSEIRAILASLAAAPAQPVFRAAA